MFPKTEFINNSLRTHTPQSSHADIGVGRDWRLCSRAPSLACARACASVIIYGLQWREQALSMPACMLWRPLSAPNSTNDDRRTNH